MKIGKNKNFYKFKKPLIFSRTEVFILVRRVRKMNGSVEPFDPNKIINSILKAGGSESLAKEIASTVEKEFADREEVTTTEIRRVILRELEKKDPDVKDSILFYDRLMKGRITFETGKFLIVRSGALYLGKNVRDIGGPGLTHLDEVKALIEEFEEDMEIGGFRADIADRRSKILIQAIKDSKMSDEDKKEAIKLVNEFRTRWKLKPIN